MVFSDLHSEAEWCAANAQVSMARALEAAWAGTIPGATEGTVSLLDACSSLATAAEPIGAAVFWTGVQALAVRSAGPEERAATSGSNFHALASDPSATCPQRANSANNLQRDLAPYELMIAYNAQGIQPGCFDEIDSHVSASPARSLSR